MKYFKNLEEIFSRIEVTDSKNRMLDYQYAVNETIKTITRLDSKKNKIILIGNGGSASIASHIATDLLKNANIPAMTFNDASLLTCISNDLGYENVFRKPLEVLAVKGDILFAISSSGSSKNIINAVRVAIKKGCVAITFSAFNKNNHLRKLGRINFYVPTFLYGYAEIAHLAICHCIVDTIMSR